MNLAKIRIKTNKHLLITVSAGRLIEVYNFHHQYHYSSGNDY